MESGDGKSRLSGRIVVVGLGPGDDSLVTSATRDAIQRIPHRFLRTRVHPSAHVVLDAPGGATTFDRLYENADDFEQVYQSIVAELVAAALQFGEILYAVPGSPTVLERTVALLRHEKSVELHVHSAVSFLDEVWRALEIDPVDTGVRLVDGHQFARVTAGYKGPMLVAHTHANWVLNDIKLAIDDANDDTHVTLLYHLSLPDERVVSCRWAEIDKVVDADHLTTLYIPQLERSVGEDLVRFHELARILREQCPWDKEQTHRTLVRYLLEEAYETVDAIEKLRDDDPTTDEALIEELGDLLYQVEFHATIAEQEGRFTIGDVARTVHDKLVSRHPHVFGDVVVSSSGEVLMNWEDIKSAEKPERSGPFDGVVESAPSLAFATKVQQRAARIGFDWPDAIGALDKVAEEVREVHDAMASSDSDTVMEELGDLMFTLVNVCRHLDVDAESALRRSVQKFRRRVLAVEDLAKSRGMALSELDLAELDRLWDEIKAHEAG